MSWRNLNKATASGEGSGPDSVSYTVVPEAKELLPVRGVMARCLLESRNLPDALAWIVISIRQNRTHEFFVIIPPIYLVSRIIDEKDKKKTCQLKPEIEKNQVNCNQTFSMAGELFRK